MRREVLMRVHDVVVPLLEADGRTNREIAKAIGVHESRVSRFRSRQDGLALPALRRLLDEVSAPTSKQLEAERAYMDDLAARGGR